MLPYTSPALFVFGGVLLAGCTVYVPMQPVMPLVSAQNPVELNATVQLNGRVEATGAYTPLPHVLLTGAATIAPKLSNDYLINRQAEVGVGTYWEVGNHWLLNGIAGTGTAYTERNDVFLSSSRYRGKYQKLFWQVGVAYKGYRYATGITYRLARVEYRYIQYNRELLSSFHNFRHEVGLFYRYELGKRNAWYMQAVAGESGSSWQPPNDNATLLTSQKWYAAGVGVPFLSIGAGWRPGARAQKNK